ncbi:MAG TPA: hypothetical protein VFJ85_08030 [Acidimicrobiales bacterium]|nr:hypothetical protein [Acidimicrobiales bacterium]
MSDEPCNCGCATRPTPTEECTCGCECCGDNVDSRPTEAAS